MPLGKPLKAHSFRNRLFLRFIGFVCRACRGMKGDAHAGVSLLQASLSHTNNAVPA